MTHRIGLFVLVCGALGSTFCGDEKTKGKTEPAYTVRGTISGLGASTVLLSLNGAESLEAGDGPFAFTTRLRSGAAYDVSVPQNPTGFVCGVVDGSGTIGSADITGVTVTCTAAPFGGPLYATGNAWTYYIDNDGTGSFDATGTTCHGGTTGGYDSCLHTAEYQTAVVPNETDCTGITGADALGVFEWSCEDIGGAATVVSHGIADGKGLSDFIDFDAASWKPNSVIVQRDGAYLFETEPSIWFTNAIVVDNDGAAMASGSSPGTIYIVNDALASGEYRFGATNSALLVKPGVTLTGPGTNTNIVSNDTATGNAYLWIEGEFDAQDTDRSCISLDATTFVQMHNVVAQRGSANRNVGVIELFDTGWLGLSANHALVGIDVHSSTSSGLVLTTTDGSLIRNLRSYDNENAGLMLQTFSGTRVENAWLVGNANHDIYALGGLYMWDGHGNTFVDIYASSGGIKVDAQSAPGVFLEDCANNLFVRMTVANNMHFGLWMGYGASFNTVYGLRSFNNGNSGVVFNTDATGNVVVDATVAANGNVGVMFDSNTGVTTNNVLMNTTVVDNEGNGIELRSDASGVVLVNTATIQNGGSGLEMIVGPILGTTIANFASAHNVGYGMHISGDTNDGYFTGALIVGNNDADGADYDCLIESSGTDPGLVLNSDAGLQYGECLQQGASDFGVATSGVTVADSIVGKLSDSQSAYDTIDDWFVLAGNSETLGRLGASASDFPHPDQVGPCASGEDCVGWDWSLVAADTVLRTAAATKRALVQTWAGIGDSGQTCALQVFADSVWVAGSPNPDNGTCETTFLLGATEIPDDGVGNDNGLCETDEACVETPNVGGYQGHGDLVSSGTYDTTPLTGIDLFQYALNGR